LIGLRREWRGVAIWIVALVVGLTVGDLTVVQAATESCATGRGAA